MTEAATMPGVSAKQIDLWFEGRGLSGGQQSRYNTILRAAKQLATTILETVPPGPDQTAAIRQLRESCSTAYQALLAGGGESSGG